MSDWSTDELDRIGATTEMRIAPRLRDGSLRTPVTIWVVRVDDDVYVRSAYGADNPWFRRARASGAGHISAGGVQRDVQFDTPPADVHPRIDAAYHAKYDRYGPAIVGTVVGADVVSTTLRLVPQH